MHQQQGAEADVVIFDTVNAGSTCWPLDEWERLINVAASRAKKLFVLLATRDEARQPFLAPLVAHLHPEPGAGVRKDSICGVHKRALVGSECLLPYVG